METRPAGPLSQRGLRVHAQRRGEAAPEGGHPGRFCLQHPLRGRGQVHRRQGERQDGAPPLPAQNGDIVEIITSPRHHPSKDWLDFVKTAQAKTKIRQWIMRQERDQSINLGQGDSGEGLGTVAHSPSPPHRRMRNLVRWPKSSPSTPWRTFTRTSDSGRSHPSR